MYCVFSLRKQTKIPQVPFKSKGNLVIIFKYICISALPPAPQETATVTVSYISIPVSPHLKSWIGSAASSETMFNETDFTVGDLILRVWFLWHVINFITKQR